MSSRFLRRFIFPVASLVLLAATVSSRPNQQQEPPPPPPPSPQQQSSTPTRPARGAEQNQEDVIRLRSRLVVVPISASDASGRPVRDLALQDFVVEEEGKPQQIVSLGEPGKTPVELALLFDVSGSTNSQFSFEQKAAAAFVKDVLKPNDTMTLFSIGCVPKLVQARTTKPE